MSFQPPAPTPLPPNGDGVSTTSATTSAQASKQLIQTSYDQIATTYHNWAHEKPSPRLHWLSKLIAHLPKSAPEEEKERRPAVLELGCGSGLPIAHALVSQGYELTANDISTSMLALCAQHVPTAKLIHSDMMSLSFPSKSFNAVVGMYSLIHLPRDEQVEVLGKIWEWLSDGGMLLANFAVADDEGKVGRWLDGKEMFWSSFGEEGNRSMVIKSGFEILEAEVVVEVEHEREVAFLWILARKGDYVVGEDS